MMSMIIQSLVIFDDSSIYKETFIDRASWNDKQMTAVGSKVSISVEVIDAKRIHGFHM